WCLARGIHTVRWTYDPMRAINARLNIAALGATAGTYLGEYYGPVEGINAGLPSDRVLAEWDLAAPGVAACAARAPVPSSAVDLRLPIPPDLDALIAADPAAALAARLDLRAAMRDAFARGLRVTGFDPAASCYLLTQVQR